MTLPLVSMLMYAVLDMNDNVNESNKKRKSLVALVAHYVWWIAMWFVTFLWTSFFLSKTNDNYILHNGHFYSLKWKKDWARLFMSYVV